jgi:hypothetical protein
VRARACGLRRAENSRLRRPRTRRRNESASPKAARLTKTSSPFCRGQIRQVQARQVQASRAERSSSLRPPSWLGAAQPRAMRKIRRGRLAAGHGGPPRIQFFFGRPASPRTALRPATAKSLTDKPTSKRKQATSKQQASASKRRQAQASADKQKASERR